MSRRAKIRWISYLAALAVCFSAALAACFTGAKRYETRINADTGRALGEAVHAVEELDRSLQKSACAVTPGMIRFICTDIYSNAQQAESALSILPVRSSSLEQIARHIAVVGDYAAMLSRASTESDRISPDSLQELAQFSGTTSALCSALTDMQSRISDGEISNETFKRITDTLDNLETAVSTEAGTMAEQMETIAEAFPDVPAMVYDGKYTDHSSDTPLGLSNAQQYTEQQARDAAADWLGCSADELKARGSVDAQIPYYSFEYNKGSIAVTQLGGKTLWVMEDTPSGDATVTQEQAEASASAYLNDHGFSDMEITQTILSGGEAEVRVAPVLNNNVLCFPDAITVTVSLAGGDVTGFDARNYWMHHTERDLQAFASGNRQTDAAIPTFLTVQSVRPVILDAVGTNERACYRYTCRDQDGAVYQICVNAKTGEQEQILLPDEVNES